MLSDLRLLRRGGGTIWTRCAVVALQSSDRAPTRYLIQVEDVTAERWAKQELEYRAFHDQLTGLRNRAWILDILPNELQSARQSGLDVGLMLIDLDEFKVVNDSMGHSAGDELLVLVSERLASVVPSDCHLGRTGGDEFVVVAPDITTPLEMETLAERVTDGLAEAVTLHGHHVVPSASIGISTSSSESTAESLLRDADSALFRAKAGGRGRWQFADSEMHRQAVDRITLVEEIRDGITRREFVAHFMPIVALEDRRIRGHEALVRWHHPTRGLLNPADFLPLAEETGLIREIGDLMLADVCRRMADRPDLQGCMSVNISAVQLRQPQWIAQFRETLQRFGVPPDRMVIEITETSVLSLMQSTLSDLTALRGIGVGVHLDDFGTGYSPISLLREVPVSGLKLDASFVRDLTDGDARATAIASSLAQLAHGLGIVGIAEGVETAEHASILTSMGWEFGQGFHFGRPDPELTASLA